MNHPQIQPISWGGGPLDFLKKMKGRKKPFALYSGETSGFSYIGADPLVEWFFYPDRLERVSEGKKEIIHSNPFSILQEIIPNQLSFSSPFFASGWVGFLNYEMAPFIDSFFPKRNLPSPTLLGWWGLYDPIFVFDHSKKEAFVSSWGLNEEMISDEKRAFDRVKGGLFYTFKVSEQPHGAAPPKNSKTESNFTKEEYLLSVQKIIDYIHAGDCYQVNLSQQWNASHSEPIDSLSFFCDLAGKYPAPFSVFLDSGETKILSFSPEEFLTIRGKEIITRPIKGTRKRKSSFEEDEKIQTELQHSQKDQSELLMIVDLERNDLGKICKPGSIEVLQLKQIESLNYVHHLVSTIRGVLREDVHPAQALSALFPGGSITGAPKKRAMEIIQELEPDPRGVYTGAIGFFDFSSYARFNIPIRTFEISNQKIKFGTGGGIVAESDSLQEYEETLVKGKLFFDLFL